jgi:hypothetical protein
VSAVKLYVEGGGDSKELHARCREEFSKLLENAGFTGRMPRIVAGGRRRAAFDMFQTALRSAEAADYPILLVDSEDAVTAAPWAHLRVRDGWVRPTDAADDQAQLMVTCMETWIMADRAALDSVFKDCLQTNALLPETALEDRPRDDVQGALEHATRPCGPRRAYRKGERSFEVLAHLNPEQLSRHLRYFRCLLETLDRHLTQPQWS